MDVERAPRAYCASAYSAGYPDLRLDRTYPNSTYFWVFNLSPGVHRVTFRVGSAELGSKARIHADAVTDQTFEFEAGRFPSDPTPRDCMAEWTPK